MFPLRDIANVALNHGLAIFSIDVANHLYIDGASDFAPEWQIFIANIAVSLKFLKCGLRGFYIFEQADLPKRFSDKLLMGVAKQLHQKGIDIGNQSSGCIEYEDSVLCCLKKTPISNLRVFESISHGSAVVSLGVRFHGGRARSPIFRAMNLWL